MTVIATVAIAAATGAAGAAGGWAWNEITHMHHRLFLMETRVMKLESK